MREKEFLFKVTAVASISTISLMPRGRSSSVRARGGGSRDHHRSQRKRRHRSGGADKAAENGAEGYIVGAAENGESRPKKVRIASTQISNVIDKSKFVAKS